MQRVARLFFFCAFVACGTQEGDTPADPTPPPPGGADRRIRDIRDPNAKDHPKHNEQVAVSGAVVVAVDTYDETGQGDRGDIFVADVGSKEPYASIGLFSPTFVPGNLRVGPGDVLDFRGAYQENQALGSSITFAPGAVLPQLSRPTGTFRYEYKAPEPVDIALDDLKDYATGARWIGQLVRVKDLVMQEDLYNPDPGKARANGPITGPARLPTDPIPTPCTQPFPKAATITNELMDLTPVTLTKGSRYASVVGVVTYFCNLHLSPRSTADFVK